MLAMNFKFPIFNFQLVAFILVAFLSLYPIPYTLYPVYGQNPEENAIYNECAATTPKELCPESATNQQNKNPLFEALNSLKSNLGGLIGLISPNINNPTKYYQQSKSTNQARIPGDLSKNPQPTKDVLGVQEDVVNNLKGFLGGSSGFFGATLPKLDSLGNEIKDYECLYQKASYPKGVAPVTGKKC
jgi:hypothetical protein